MKVYAMFDIKNLIVSSIESCTLAKIASERNGALNYNIGYDWMFGKAKSAAHANPLAIIVHFKLQPIYLVLECPTENLTDKVFVHDDIDMKLSRIDAVPTDDGMHTLRFTLEDNSTIDSFPIYARNSFDYYFNFVHVHSGKKKVHYPLFRTFKDGIQKSHPLSLSLLDHGNHWEKMAEKVEDHVESVLKPYHEHLRNSYKAYPSAGILDHSEDWGFLCEP